MAREDARTAGIIGTGLQARTQLEAVALARKLDRVRAFGRDPERRERFAKEMSDRLGIPVSAVSSAEEAVRDADIVVTATGSVQPVLDGRWLSPGAHVNAIGSNYEHKSELDSEAVLRADIIAVDSLAQARIEAGDLIQAFGKDAARWDNVRELSSIVAGKTAGRTSSAQITLFKSVGLPRKTSPSLAGFTNSQENAASAARFQCGKVSSDLNGGSKFLQARTRRSFFSRACRSRDRVSSGRGAGSELQKISMVCFVVSTTMRQFLHL